jgi:hypothetical protein
MPKNYTEFEQILKTMREQSIPFRLVKREMIKRGHWKGLPRGRVVLENLDKRKSK